MDAQGEKQPPFDESAALEELERLREQIAKRQSQRRQAEEEFDRFIRSFKMVGAPDRTQTPDQVEDAPFPPESPPVPPGPSPVVSASLLSPAPPPAPDPVESAPSPFPLRPAWARSRTRPVSVGLVILGVIVAGGLLSWTILNSGSESPPAALPAPAPPAESAATAKPTPATANAPPPQAELTTTRRVWVRVIADGSRVLERELPAGSRVPLTAQKTIVVRTGNAGAVRVYIQGKDRGFLGGEGQVVTRTFNVPRPGSAER